MNKKFVGILLILISFTAFADEDIPAPLGLVWGTSGDVLKNEYSASLDEAEHSRLKFYEINKTPINSAEFNKVYGFVDDKYGLVKVVLVKDISSDAYGSEGLELYKKYKMYCKVNMVNLKVMSTQEGKFIKKRMNSINV